MNEEHFDRHLREAMPAADATETLDRKINRRIAGATVRGTRVRRFVIVGGAVAAVTAAVVFMPSRAEAVLQRIAGSLDDVDHFVMTRYAVLPDGAHKAHASMTYSRARWKFIEPGRGESIYRRGEMITYDPVLKVYRRTAQPDGPFMHNVKGIGLRSLLASGGMSPDTKVTVEDATRFGRSVIKAVQSNPRERIVIYADPKTDRPLEAEVSTASAGWQVVEVLLFDYSSSVSDKTFEPDPKVRVVTNQEAAQILLDKLTATSFMERPNGKAKFILRKVDVAADGTVFVVYQAGDRGSGWRGFRLVVTDDQGNEFAAPAQPVMVADQAAALTSKEGRIQTETFVPLKPAASWRARKITISAHFKEDTMIQFVYGFSKYEDGTWEFRKFPNNLGVTPETIPPAQPIWSQNFDSPTCEWRPEHMAMLDFANFSSDLRSRIWRADHLARRNLNFGLWSEAGDNLEQAIALKEQAAREGLGSYATTEDRDNLRRIRSGAMTRPPSLR